MLHAPAVGGRASMIVTFHCLDQGAALGDLTAKTSGSFFRRWHQQAFPRLFKAGLKLAP
jgi:hypothetical protein